MTTTVPQALQLAIAAHKEGNLTKAENIYRSILESQPNHPDANHNLGVLAASVGKLKESRPYLKTALESKPGVIQFWLSYLEVLSKLGHSDIVRALLEKTKHAGLKDEDIFKLKARFTPNLKNKRASLQKSTKELVGLYSAGRLNEALALGEILSEQFSKDPNIFNILGAINSSLGKIENAINNYKKAINIKPGFSEVHNNLALSLKKLARNEEAVVVFKKAIQLDPNSHSIHYNLGNTQNDLGQHEEAIASFNRAIKLNPKDASIHNNLGNSLKALARSEEAIASFERAIKLKPDFDAAHINLAQTLEELEKYHEAIQHYDSANTLTTKYKALECLYKQERYEEFNQRIINLTRSNDDDIGVAAVSAYVSHQLNQEDPYPFCRNPLDFFSVGNLAHRSADVDVFIDKILEETANAIQVWEPKNKTTHFGFQTEQTIFEAGDSCAELAKIIGNEIESYYSKFKSEECTFINSWPQQYYLKGWFVRLVKNGHQKSHIHPSGWLSGVVYLKTIDPLDGNEGSIELSLHGDDLPILNKNYPQKIFQPKKGDIILFPSSLFHRTIPINTDTERCVIAFDLYRQLP